MHTRLSLPNACLERVPFLQDLPLVEVDLQGNHLRTLDNLPLGLIRLNVSYNWLLGEDILYPFPHLEDLNVSHNRVNVWEDDEFLSCYPSLKKLNLSYNPVKHTDFLKNSSVEELILTRCQCKTISGLPSTLRVLTADTNPLAMLQSRLPDTLEVLNLTYNCLRYAGLPLTWGPSLRELHLDHNDIERFPRKLPESLEILTLNHNCLTDLPNKLPASLQILMVNSNRIRQLPTYKNHKRFTLFLADDNCLAEIPDVHSRVFSAQENWDTPEYKEAQQKIRTCWKRYVLTLRLRHFKRTVLVRDELFTVSMMPERWDQIDTLSSDWTR
jgi:E3 ubiquitin-protein ligase SlrP